MQIFSPFLSNIITSREKLEREHDGPKLVTAKCCALLFSDKMNVNYIATFLRVHRPFFEAEDDKSIYIYKEYIILLICNIYYYFDS